MSMAGGPNLPMEVQVSQLLLSIVICTKVCTIVLLMNPKRAVPHLRMSKMMSSLTKGMLWNSSVIRLLTFLINTDSCCHRAELGKILT